MPVASVSPTFLAVGAASLLLLTAGCGPDALAEGGPADPRRLEVDCIDADTCYREGTALLFDLEDSDAIRRGVACHIRGCELGHGEACMDAGLQYWGGFFIEQDLLFAQELFERSCSLDFGQGCNKAGTMFEMGWGGTHDPSAARSFYRKGCDLGDAESCHDLTTLQRRDP